MEEIWKVKEGYSRYEISNLGRVKVVNRTFKINSNGRANGRLVNINEKFRKPFVSGGVSMLHLKNDLGKVTLHSIHRLVGELFLEKQSDAKFIQYVNGDKYDFTINNIRWEDKKKRQTNICVDKFDLNGNFIESFYNLTDAAKSIGVIGTTIYSILDNDNRQSKGFKFKRSQEQIKFRNKQIISNTKKHIKNKVVVYQLSLDGVLINIFETVKIKDLEKQLGYKPRTIINNLNGYSKKQTVLFLNISIN